MPRDHDFDRHHGDLVGYAGERDDRLAKLYARRGITNRLLHGSLRDADGACRGLDARQLERGHELLKAEALDATEKILPPSR